MAFSWKALFGSRPRPAYFVERSDADVEGLLLEAIRGSRMRALSFGNGIVHGMRIPWDQARRVVEKLKARGVVDYEIPYDTWVSIGPQGFAPKTA